MESPQLVQYLRTGTIAPLKKGDSKGEVAANLGKPNDWAGRIKCFTWHEPPIDDFRKSQGWWYGSLGVGFDTRGRLKSMSLDYTAIHGPTLFRPPFHELPATSFCLRDLIEMMDANGKDSIQASRDWLPRHSIHRGRASLNAILAVRQIPMPIGPSSQAFGFADKTVLFDEQCGLPKSVKLFATNGTFACDYEVLAATNYLGRTFPVQFRVRLLGQPANGSVRSGSRTDLEGSVISIRSGKWRELPDEVRKKLSHDAGHQSLIDVTPANNLAHNP